MSKLKKLDKVVKERNEIIERYKELFKSFECLSFLEIEDNVYSSFHLGILILIHGKYSNHLINIF